MPADLKILEMIGKGTFGEVYRGKWAGAEVAIKMINALNDTKIDEIIQEVSVMLDIGNHPNVVQFFGYCREAGNQCMVMQYFDGGYVCKLITDIDKGIHDPITE